MVEKPGVQAWFSDNRFKDCSRASVVKPKTSMSAGAEEKPTEEEWGSRESPVCLYYRKRGHVAANCPALYEEKKPTQSVACPNYYSFIQVSLSLKFFLRSL